MQHDIIDNRTRKLADCIRPLLGESERAKFAVGYFFLSGFKLISAELEKLTELRLLIGNVSDYATLERLAETHAASALIEKTRTRRFANAQERAAELEKVAAAMRVRLERITQTDDDERLLRTLLRLVQDKRFLVRVYTRSRLHAKAYIFDYPAGRYDVGMAIVGSSNLSLAGLTDNTELNVEVRGTANHIQLTQWFNELWDESSEFNLLLMRELGASWALQRLTPFELYVNVLLHLVRDRLSQQLKAMPADFPALADFQWAAVQTALKLLKRQNGVILGDVVGLGKTLMGTAMLKWLYARDRWRALIITPSPLVRMWELFNNHYGLRARVLGVGKMRTPEFTWDATLDEFEPQVVLIDESHNFRHSDTEQYERLIDLLHARGLPCILLTATPRNRVARDVYNQIHLFHPDDETDIGVSPPDLRAYFNLVHKGERELPPLLQHFMVRRTRRHISEHWPDARIDGRPVRFPKRRLETVSYNINAAYDGFYTMLRRLIEPPNAAAKKTDGLRYARYQLVEYVQPALRRQNPYRDLARAGQRLRGLMRALLFKRLESSVEAFRLTITRLLESHRIFLKLLDEGFVSAGDGVDDLLKGLSEGDAEDEALLEELRRASGKYSIAHFDVTRLRGDLLSDVGCLERMKNAADPITPDRDAKLQRLLAWINEHPLLRAERLLIFTQFSDTAAYLGRHLAPRYPGVEVADSSRNDLDKVVKRFAPRANRASATDQRPAIHLLVATDVLSEGLNLQDAASLVNYDLHWNPVRLIQRFGRIDRLNTEHAEVLACNFLPDPHLEQHLGIRRILSERIAEIHASIGEDAPILEPGEQLNESALYAIYEGDGSALEAYEESDQLYDSLGIQFAEDFIRRLQRDDPALFARVEQLPNAVRAARRFLWPASPGSPLAKLARPPAIFFFGQCGDFQKLYLADDAGEILVEDAFEAIAALRCESTEPALPIPSGHNTLVERLRAKFEEACRTHIAAAGTPHRMTPPQRKAVDLVKTSFDQAADATLRDELAHLRELFRLKLDARAETELRDWQRTRGTDDAIALDRLRDIAFACKLEEQHTARGRAPGAGASADPVIICTEALVP